MKRFKRTRTALAPIEHKPIIPQAAPLFFHDAIGAFEKAYGAIFAHTVSESERLAKTNAALEALEEKLLDPGSLEEMTPGVQVELYKALRYNAENSTRLLLDITRTITQTRAVGQILQNLKEVAQRYDERQSQQEQLAGKNSKGQMGARTFSV